jgi:dihydrofolate reductase
MIISLIVAMDEARGIGAGNQILWHLSDDLKRFKSLTMGHHVIMGRKTYESIGRPLPGRTTIIITRNPNYQAADGAKANVQVSLARSLEQALAMAQAAGESEAFVIGGGEIFAQALPLAERIYLTTVQAQFECDVFFPRIDPAEWRILEESSVPADEKNQFASTYRLLIRK